MKKAGIILLFIFAISSINAQESYQDISYDKIVKAKLGPVKKVLRSKRVFISDFVIRQVTAVSASAQGFGALQGGSSKASLALALSGIESEKYQQAVNEMYDNFVAELQKQGFEIVSDEEAMKAYQSKDFAKRVVAKTPDGPKVLTKKLEAVAEFRPSDHLAIFRDQKNLNTGADFASLMADKKIGKELSRAMDAAIITVDFKIGIAAIKTNNSIMTAVSAVKAWPMLRIDMTGQVYGKRISENGGFYTKKTVEDINYWVSNMDKKGKIKTHADGGNLGYMGWQRTEMTSPIIANEQDFLKEVRGVINGVNDQVAIEMGDKL